MAAEGILNMLAKNADRTTPAEAQTMVALLAGVGGKAPTERMMRPVYVQAAGSGNIPLMTYLEQEFGFRGLIGDLIEPPRQQGPPLCVEAETQPCEGLITRLRVPHDTDRVTDSESFEGIIKALSYHSDRDVEPP